MDLPEGWDADSQADSGAQRPACNSGCKQPTQSASKQATAPGISQQQQQHEHWEACSDGAETAETDDSLAALHLVNPYQQQQQQKQGIINNKFVGQF